MPVYLVNSITDELMFLYEYPYGAEPIATSMWKMTLMHNAIALSAVFRLFGSDRILLALSN